MRLWPVALAALAAVTLLRQAPGVGPRQAQLIRLACVPSAFAFDGAPGVEVEVTSADPFPVRNALVKLTIGPVVSYLSRYPDGGDQHTLIFLLTPAELASLAPSDIAVVGFDPGSDFDTWQVGPLDPSTAVGCEDVLTDDSGLAK